MRIRMNSRWLLFILITTCFLIISEGRVFGSWRGDSSRIPSVVDYYPHLHQEEEATTQPPKVEGAIIHPQPDQEVEDITIKVEAGEEKPRRGSHNDKEIYPGETPPSYSGGGISGANYPRKPRMRYGRYFQSGALTYWRPLGHFCATPVGIRSPIYPERPYYTTKTIERKLIPPQSSPRAPDNMNYGGLPTETNVHSKPETKKRIRNPKKNRKNKRKKNRNSSYGKESMTNATDIPTHSSDGTTQETVTITSEADYFQETNQRNWHFRL